MTVAIYVFLFTFTVLGAANAVAGKSETGKRHGLVITLASLTSIVALRIWGF